MIHEKEVTLRSLIRTRAMPGVITDVECAGLTWPFNPATSAAVASTYGP